VTPVFVTTVCALCHMSGTYDKKHKTGATPTSCGE